jgi:hypothetical protein
VAKFDVTLANVVSSAGSRTLLPVSVFASSAKNPFAPVTRTYPVYFPYPHQEEDEVRVTLSDTLAPAVLPAAANLNAGALRYTNETKQAGKVVTFKRTMVVDTMMLDAKHYTPLRTFYSHVNAADQKPLVLQEKP